MTDYGHDLVFGSFLTPTSADPARVVALARHSEQVGLDLVTVQDHPYHPGLLDAWTLLSYLAAATETVSLAPNVLNLPLRPPAVLARAASGLDLLSGGRVELGLGAGAFWDAIEAMGGPRRTPGEAVAALTEAITLIRELWAADERGGIRSEGPTYPLSGAKRGPAPAHPISIWLGAYGPRMLRLTGATADGWLPSAAYLAPDKLAAANTIIDEAARAAGREPGAVRRLYNIAGRFDSRTDGFLVGPVEQWVEQLSGLALEQGISAFILGTDDADDLARFGQEVAPAVREAVLAGRAPTDIRSLSLSKGSAPAIVPVQANPSFTVVPTPDDGRRLTTERPLAEPTRPRGPAPDPDHVYSPRELASGQHLVDIHDHLRGELAQVRDLVAQVLASGLDVPAARAEINQMALRQNRWTVGANCAAYNYLLTTHHTIEDQAVFPRLRQADPGLGPVLDRLGEEHHVIHDVLDRVDAALVRFVDTQDGAALQHATDLLSDALLSHLSYEERELVEPLARTMLFSR